MVNKFLYKEQTYAPSHAPGSKTAGTVVLVDKETLGYEPDTLHAAHTFHFHNLHASELAKVEALGPHGEFILIKAGILDDQTLHISPSLCSGPGNDDLSQFVGRYQVFKVTFTGGEAGGGSNENTGKVAVRSGVTGF